MGALKSKKCARGHKLSGDNVRIRPDGKRDCLACAKIRHKAWRERQREK